MAGELVVADGQYQLRNLLIGAGSKFRWETSPILWGGADTRPIRNARPSAHGVRGGRDLLGAAAAVRGRIAVLGESGADLQSLLDQLGAAWAPSDVDIPFVGQQLGSKRRRYGRPGRWAPVDDATTFEHSALVAVDFDALDPLVYSDVEHSSATTIATPGTGFAPPFTPPFTIGASSGGTISAPNAGIMPAPWTARLDGPLTNPALTHVQSGKLLELSANGGLVLAPGDFALIDSAERSVLVAGTADRRTNLRLPYGFFDLAVGTNTILFAADAGAGTVTFNWRDAWL